LFYYTTFKSLNYIIDMGPGGGEEGGRIVVAGVPEEIADSPESLTGRHIQLMRSDSNE
jgi:excinuclease ABC subunit A